MLVAACQRLRQLAISSLWTISRTMKRAESLADIIKVNFRTTPQAVRADDQKYPKAAFVAMKIETAEEFKR